MMDEDREYPRWETQTTKVDASDLSKMTGADMVAMLKRVDDIARKDRDEAMEYAKDWPSPWQPIGADFYQSHGPRFANKIKKALKKPEFAEALSRALIASNF